MKLHLRSPILAFLLFVCMIIHLAAFDSVDMVVFGLDILVFTGHNFLLHLCLFPLLSSLPSASLNTCPTLNISEDIMNIVYPFLLTWLVFCLPLSLPLFSLQGWFSGERQGSVLIYSILCSVQNNSGIVLCFYSWYVLCWTLQPTQCKHQAVFCFHHANRNKCCSFSHTNIWPS